jgi:hypothetical protein
MLQDLHHVDHLKRSPRHPDPPLVIDNSDEQVPTCGQRATGRATP